MLSRNPSKVFRVGAVCFLNTKPLIWGLDRDPRIRLTLDVPSRLGRRLESGELDAALVPAIDYRRARSRWRIAGDGCIAGDGETLTVRIFSRVPAERIATLAADGDSHTSVVLAKVVLANRFGCRPRIVPADRDRLADHESVLLIGDKVIRELGGDWPVQLDLGAAWREWTGLPFVFAVWAAPADSEPGELEAILSAARDRGVEQTGRLADELGPPLGWPVELARRYLAEILQFKLTPRHREGMERFFELCETDFDHGGHGEHGGQSDR